jgi:Raffinose synthase or seed imbibition protein Sip1
VQAGFILSTIAAAGIVQGMTSLEAAGVPPRLLIIDDGWQLTVADADGQTDDAVRPEPAAPAEPQPAEAAATQQ